MRVGRHDCAPCLRYFGGRTRTSRRPRWRVRQDPGHRLDRAKLMLNRPEGLQDRVLNRHHRWMAPEGLHELIVQPDNWSVCSFLRTSSPSPIFLCNIVRPGLIRGKTGLVQARRIGRRHVAAQRRNPVRLAELQRREPVLSQAAGEHARRGACSSTARCRSCSGTGRPSG